MKEKKREREREYRCSRQRLYGRSEYSSEPPPAVNWNSLEAYADWSARHFSDFNDNRIMMITPFTERTCYLFLSTSFSLSFSPSLSPRPTVYLDAKTCIERGKRRAPSILYRSIDPCFFFACDPRCDTNSCSHGRTSRERYPDGGAITSCTVIPDKFGINVSVNKNCD